MAVKRPFACCLMIWFPCWCVAAWAQPPSTAPVEGLRQNTPTAHVFRGATIVPRPGESIADAVMVIRDGVIIGLGTDVTLPGDARIWDVSGKTIYPGLIDAYGEADAGESGPSGGAPSWNDQVRPQLRMSQSYQADSSLNERLRSQGIVARLVAPASGIVKGLSAVVSTGDQDNSRTLLAADVAQHLQLTVSPGRGRDSYPNSPMGAVALARQILYDANWYGQAWNAARADHRLPLPERNDALDSLDLRLRQQGLFIIDAPNELFVLRADRFAREFGLNIALRGSGNEYRRLDDVAKTGRTIIVPIRFPKPPNVASIEAAADVRLDELMHWELAPENPGRLVRAGVPIALTTHGLEDPRSILSSIRTAIQRGLEPAEALKACTTTPAKLLGLSDRLGELAAGRAASFVVTDGSLFGDKTRILETWIDGRRFVVNDDSPIDWRGHWIIRVSRGDGANWVVDLRGEATKLTGTLRPQGTKRGDEQELKLARLGLKDARLGCTFPAQTWQQPGQARLSAVAEIAGHRVQRWSGQIAWPDGTVESIDATRDETQSSDDDQPDEPAEQKADLREDQKADQPDDDPANKPDDQQPAETPSTSSESSSDPSADKPDKSAAPGDKKDERPVESVVNYPLGAQGLASAPEQPQVLAVTGATIWTGGPAGVIERGTMLVRQGVIEAVGAEVTVPSGAVVLNARGQFVSPGIIDCHSHMATDGGINESGQAITAEVRIGDFIDADDINIYRQLAGGVTCSNILHGSANPIGGQNQVIKLRWGATPEEMKMAEAPAGIKFALGENVKQSNWGERFGSRYPQTRMGVEQLIRDALQAAKQYDSHWRQWNRDHQGLPPRRDLELEALAEVVQGSRWIHCHSYRQDEILALMRTLDDFQVRIGTFQHILEGYKVADAMAQHGAMGSAFSDWWAYKFEVFDAIPYNGALMHNAGVVVSFNSDDRELARHLNHEAAKAVKYGGVPAEEALKFVTLNPARQLRIEQYVGSLEPGKQADFVIWSDEPLSTLARCEQTWVDGRKYFDRQQDRQVRAEQQALRNRLIQKILDSGSTMRRPGERDQDHADLWPHEDLFCHRHGHDDEHHDFHAHDQGEH